MVKRYAAAALLKDMKILLGFRSRNRELYPGFWDFIGGHCYENETFEEAMKRELHEELNIVPLHYKNYISIDQSPDFILNLFIVTKWKGEPVNFAKNENEKIEWFTFDDAKKLKFPDTAYVGALNSIAQKKCRYPGYFSEMIF